MTDANDDYVYDEASREWVTAAGHHRWKQPGALRPDGHGA